MNELEIMGRLAADAKHITAGLKINEKNNALLKIADLIVERTDYIIEENKKDMEIGKSAGMKESLLDRLKLTPDRIKGMAEGVRQVAALEDPVGEVISMWERPNGLKIGKKRVPIGVIGIIYESRPNVTLDAFSLCFKSGNTVILKGGSDAINSNKAIVSVIKEGLTACDISEYCIQLIESTDRAVTTEFMHLNGYVDVLIPRGGAGLIRSVVENATIPVIETGTGNCHIFVDESADFDMALDIIVNAKTQRTGVCNACESLIVHKNIADKFVPALAERLFTHKVEIRGDERSRVIVPDIKAATEELIAQTPIQKRDESRLMLLDKNTGEIQHKIFKDIIDYLEPGDCIVRNNTKVIPARLYGKKETGANVEFVLLKNIQGDIWEAMVRPGNKLHAGVKVEFGDGLLKA